MKFETSGDNCKTVCQYKGGAIKVGSAFCVNSCPYFIASKGKRIVCKKENEEKKGRDLFENDNSAPLHP